MGCVWDTHGFELRFSDPLSLQATFCECSNMRKILITAMYFLTAVRQENACDSVLYNVKAEHRVVPALSERKLCRPSWYSTVHPLSTH